MALTAPPVAPNRATMTSLEFTAAADATMDWLPINVSELSALQIDVASKQTVVVSNAITAQTQADIATAQAAIATGAVATSGAVLWVSGTTYSIGNIVYSPLSLTNYRRKTAGAGSVDPSVDTTNWVATSPLATGSNILLFQLFGGL